MHSSKNYMADGGDKWVVGGTLEIAPGATVTGATLEEMGMASAENLGAVQVGEGLEATAQGVLSAKVGDGLEITADGEIAVTAAANQADSEATDVSELVDDFNALLAKLVAAGLMAPAAQEIVG